MKINWKRVLRVAGRLIVAAPALADAIGPLLRKRRKPAAARDDYAGKPSVPTERADDAMTSAETFARSSDNATNSTLLTDRHLARERTGRSTSA